MNKLHNTFSRMILAINALSVAALFVSCSSDRDKGHDSRGTSLPADAVSSRAMLVGDWVPEDTHTIDFDNLPKVPSEYAVVSDVRDAGGTRVNQHNYLVFYADRFWAMWSDGPGVPRADPDKHRNVTPGHDRAGQRVSFATSIDGITWTAPKFLTGAPEEGYGWIARGFWVRDGKLLALASRFKAPSYAGEGLQLHAFHAEPDKSLEWKHLGMVYDNALNNFPPKKLITGEWMMSRRDSLQNVYFMVGGTKSFDQWESFPMVSYRGSELAAEEPNWWMLPSHDLVALFRDNNGSGYLYRSFSTDHGRTWSAPVQTNFPDAKSKFSVLRLSDGRYAMVSNPDPKKRDPIAISISDDGMVFNKMGYLVGGRKVDYPHVIEHEGHLYVTFSSAKQSVEVLKIKISDLDQLKMN